ncbi:2-C-methyl-D-erythritol 4-phosphate cytidylyltransferase [Sanyastnella coralliicola]|uniref:2-C-methyl-D-erythritol 4-phosphate cytidylyltransferase n=1 Tax=Sanyastnella coralliicola TaxID=3069118 RepID=UPI0027BA90D5|nr:2-C-methyl-D-erythritol 4-phosphate cytidylyltransferase [Longitalea sp. SCSIO 12813]
MKRHTIIVAGGIGKRMGSDLPKQFIVVKGLPILGHTLNVFHSFDPEMELIVVLPSDWQDYWKNECEQFNLPAHRVVDGGKERFHSVLEGLKACAPGSLVAIHDAVRPLVSVDTIARCFASAESEGGAVPVIAVNESLRQVKGDQNSHVDRADYRVVQTPQCFRYDELIRGYDAGFQSHFTDDASVYESLGKAVTMVEGNVENIKVTSPMDLVLLEGLI